MFPLSELVFASRSHSLLWPNVASSWSTQRPLVPWELGRKWHEEFIWIQGLNFFFLSQLSWFWNWWLLYKIKPFINGLSVSSTFQVFLSVSLILGDGLYNFIKILASTIINVHHRVKKAKTGKLLHIPSLNFGLNYKFCIKLCSCMYLLLQFFLKKEKILIDLRTFQLYV